MSDILDHPDNTANVHLSAVAPDLPAMRGSKSFSYSALFAPQVDERDYYALQSDIELGGESTKPGRTLDKKSLKLWSDTRKWRLSKGLPWWNNVLLSDEYWSVRKQGRPGRLGGLESTVIGDLVSRSVALRGDSEDEAVDAEREALVPDVSRVRETWDEPTLRAWCEAYTANPLMIKNFVLNKEVWGWDLGGLESAVKGAIASTGYTSPDVTVNFVLDDVTLSVRPDNWFSKIVGSAATNVSHLNLLSSNSTDRKGFVNFLLWIFMFWPIYLIALFFYPNLAGFYAVTRATCKSLLSLFAVLADDQMV